MRSWPDIASKAIGMRMAMMRMMAGGTTLIAALLFHEAVQAETKQECSLWYERTRAPLGLDHRKS
jgi:hypothetical protein